ncbi:unnamed protein product [Schistocephalus solidus]|uniref:C2H2-type domain-containing protein n=1 Tax=Schistocephalus solidus TaxID=70667 RepID=A0A183SRB0_SCHSO|nr:unnamed protein product [Schistocephalus solidus]
MAKQAARKSQAPRINTANAHALPTCPLCQRTFRARSGLVGHLRTQCTNNPRKSTSATPASNPTTTTNPTTDNNFIDALQPTITEPILSPPLPGSITATNTTCPTPTISVATLDFLSPAIFNTIAAPSTSDGDSVPNCPHCDRTFTSHIGLVGHLRLYRTETGELVPGAPAHSGGRHLQCPHCQRAFTHRMGLLGRMRIHESGIHRNASTSCAPINTSHIPPMSSNTSTSSRSPQVSAPPKLSCPHCHRTCTSRIGLVVHVRIHRTETGEPVTGAPTYTRHTQLNYTH